MQLKLSLYLARHLQAGLNSIGKLSRSPFSTIATCLIIGISLALPTGLFIVLKNAEIISGSFQQNTQLTLYLKQNVTKSSVLELAQQLKASPHIQDTRIISPREGLIELQKQAGFDNTLQNLPNNPLPWVIVIYPNEFHNSAFVEHLREQLKKLPEIEDVQVDMLWVKRLVTVVKFAHRITYVLAIFLGIAVLLIVNNIIRTATEWHNKEIELIRLIGGTNSFIRRPFLYTGIFYGFLGGLLAWQFVDFSVFLLSNPVKHLAKLYDSPFQLTGMGASNILTLLTSSILLGLIGSWVAVTRYLIEAETHQRHQ